MNQTIHAVLLVGVMSVGTILLRFLPFLLFPSGKKTPAFVTYLGKVLPFAMIEMCIRDRSRINRAKELLSYSKLSVATIATEMGFKNTLTFIRNFKAYTNMTPSEYRQNF